MRLKPLLPFLLFWGFNATAQVTLQTGAPSINIPIIQYADEASKLKLDISLGYTGGNGIKVDEKASEVGLGWTLNAGGLVQRIKVGEPDDQKAITVNDNVYIQAGIFNAPQYIQGYPNLSPDFFKLGWNPTYDQNSKVYYDPLVHYDREHDQFVYTMNGQSGKFILGTDINHSVIEEELSGNKIYPIESVPQGAIAGSLQGFYIIDNNGIKYTYQNMLLSAIMNFGKGCYKARFITNTATGANYIGWQFVLANSPRNSYIQDSYYLQPDDNNIEIYVPYETGYKIADVWYLSNIENVATNKKIVFNYTTKNFTENGGIFSANSTTDILKTNGSGEIDKTITSLIISEEYQNIEYPELYRIDLPDDKKILFKYNTSRKDQVGKASLDEIEYYNSNQLQNKYALKYGYFYESSIVDENALPLNVKKRDIALALKSLTKYGSDGTSEPATAFEYYSGVLGSPIYKFPERNSFSKDHWGYYNGINNSVRNVNEQISPFALRNFIVTPNTTRVGTSDINIAQIGMLKSINNAFGGKTIYTYGLNKSMSNNLEVLSGGIRVEEIKMVKNLTDFTAQKFEYENAQGICSGDLFEIPNYRTSSNGFFWQPNQSRYSHYKSSYANIVSQGINVISKISTFTTALAKVEATALAGSGYGLTAFATSASMVLAWFQLLRMTGLFTRQAGISQEFRNTTDASAMVFANNYIVPNYSIIKQSNYGNQGTILTNSGSTVYEFNSNINLPISFPFPTLPYSNKQRKLGFLYNQPKSLKVYDHTGNLVNEKTFSYTPIVSEANSFFNSYKYLSITTVSSPDDPEHNIGFDQASSYIPFSSRLTDSYKFYFGKSYLTQAIERQYKGNSFIESKTDYTYIPGSHLQRSVITTDSKGDINESKIYYSSDYTTPTEMDLVSKNIITPIATEVWKTKAGGTPQLLSTAVTEYGTVANGDLKPVKSYSLETDIPVSQSTIGEFNPALPIRDPNLIRLNTTIIYDVNGNRVQETTSPNNTVNSIMYNNDNLPIASAANAIRSEIAYTSFEDKGEINGGFQIVQDDIIVQPGGTFIPFYTTELSPTGTRCANLNNPLDAIKTLNPITKESILSFWATTNDFKINSHTPTPAIAGPTINGWTYYQFTIPAGAPPQSITGHTKIDEVRLYPSNAKMITTSFDLSNNKTAECDINNRITYFESDKLGRPTKVMDEKRNVIKTFEYHFKNN